MSCKKAQEFLDTIEDLNLCEKTDARKTRIDPEEAYQLVQKCTSLVAVKGKKVNRYSLKDGSVSKEEILKQIMGPSGNLRAPTIKIGKAIVVGFNLEAYEELMK